jgi:phage shock protein PspC (stress-responsive transcriptional regulator)
VFNITDDACRNLNGYLDSLYKYFEHEKGGNEIIADIEARIAELFAERAGGVSQAITNKDVLHVIETLGTPEDIADSDSSEGDDRPPYGNRKKYAKRLYRDSDNSVLGGVCAGIAAWLEISVILVRLIFVVCFLFYGIPVLIYFLLWIIIPLAKTTAQKLEMQGQEINVSNIEKSIKGNMDSSGLRSSGRSREKTAGTDSLPKKIWTVIRIVAGIILCCIGVCMALSFCSLLLLHDVIFNWSFFPLFPFNGFLSHIVSRSSYTILSVSTAVFMILTVAACIYWGVKAITGTKVKYPQIHIVLLIIYFIIPSVIGTQIFREAGNYFGYNKSVKTIPVNTGDTVYLTLKSTDLETLGYPSGGYFDDENNRFYGKPEMHIYLNENDGISKLQIIKTSRGKNKHTALKYANDINYQFDVENSQITFSPYFTIDPLNDWKNQRLEITLSVPENTVIIIDETLCYSDIIKFHSGHDGHPCAWIMTKRGLKALIAN